MIYTAAEEEAIVAEFVNAVTQFRRHLAGRVETDLVTAASWPDADWLRYAAALMDVIGDVAVDAVIAGAGPLGFAGRPMVAAAGDVVAAEGGTVGYGFDVYDPVVQSIAQEHIASIVNYSAAMRSQVNAWIDEGLAKGKSVADMVTDWREMGGPLTDKWAAMRARTELNAASNGSLLGAWTAAGIPMKQWITANDQFVRESHAELEGVTIPVDAEFDVGGYPAQYPADDSLPDEERANCRCALISVEEPAGAEGFGP